MTVKRQIETLVTHWMPLLGLGRWRIAVRWDEKQHVATCQAQPVYEDATLSFNLPRIQKDLRGQPAKMKEAWLEELVVHELTHALIWRSNERTVTMVSRAFIRLRDGA